MDEPTESDAFHALFRFLCRHLVCIVCKHEATRPDDAEGRQILMASGFIMEFQGIWFLATAGHFMQQLDELRKSRPDRRIAVTIVDNFATGAIDDTMVPLDYYDSPRQYEHDEEQGLDFGLIPLRSNTCDLLHANGVVPVDEAHWRDWSDVQFASYTIVGVLAERCHEIARNGLFMATAQFDLSPIEIPPAQLARFTQPMRFFRITNLGNTNSIVGMSGCPILGFRWDEAGRLTYFFIGIQSGWIPGKQIIYACDLPFLARQLISYFKPTVEDGTPLD